MRVASRFLIIIGCGTLILVGCGRREAPPPRPVPVRPPEAVRPMSAANYVAEASSIDLLVIQASELAQSRARSARLRDLAAMLVRDHRGGSAQLSFAGRRLNLLPSATLSVGHRAILDQLASTSDFDSSYVQQMIRVHEQGYKLHSDFLRGRNSPTLEPVAELVAPIMRRHLEALRGMR